MGEYYYYFTEKSIPVSVFEDIEGVSSFSVIK